MITPTRRPLAPLLAALLMATAGCAFREDVPGAELVAFSPANRIEALPPPTVGYRAVQVMEIDGHRYTGEVYAMPGVKRLEMPTASEDVVSVTRYDEGTVVNWLGGTQVVSEMPVGHFGLDLRSPDYVAFDMEPVGPETVNGRAATKYAFTATAVDGTMNEGVFWLTPENILVRLEAVQSAPDADPRRLVMALEDLRMGPQDPALFEPPRGATFAPLPDLEGLDGFLENLFGI